MGDDWRYNWRYDSWTGLTSNWMLGSEYSSDYSSSNLFNLVLKKAGESETREEIDKCSEKLNQLKAEKAEQSLVLLNSAMTGETDPVASLKLAQIEVDIDETQRRLTEAEIDQYNIYQETLKFVNSYIDWKSGRGSDLTNTYGWGHSYSYLEDEE